MSVLPTRTHVVVANDDNMNNGNNDCVYLCSVIVHIAFIVALILFLQDKDNFSDKASPAYLDFMLNGATVILPLSIIHAIFLSGCCTLCLGKSCVVIITISVLLMYLFTMSYSIAVALFLSDDANFNLVHVIKPYRTTLYVGTVIGACGDAIMLCMAVIGACITTG